MSSFNFLDLASSLSQTFLDEGPAPYYSNRESVAPPLPPRGRSFTEGRTGPPDGSCHTPLEERPPGLCGCSPGPPVRLPPALPIRRPTGAQRSQGSPELASDKVIPPLPPATFPPAPPPLHSRTIATPPRLPPPLPPKSTTPKATDTAYT